MVDQAELEEERIDDAPARVEHPGPEHRADRAGQHPGEKDDRAERGDADEVAIEEQRAGGADDHDQRRREQREDERVAQRRAEILAGDDVPVIVEPHPVLLGEEEHHLVQAGPQRVADREDGEERDRQDDRQEPECRETPGPHGPLVLRTEDETRPAENSTESAAKTLGMAARNGCRTPGPCGAGLAAGAAAAGRKNLRSVLRHLRLVLVPLGGAGLHRLIDGRLADHGLGEERPEIGRPDATSIRSRCRRGRSPPAP